MVVFAGLVFWAARILAQEGPAQAEPPTKPQRVEGLVLIVKTGKGVGTAFRYQDKDGAFLISNLHVVAGPAPLEIYDTEGRKAEVGAFLEVAKDTDLVRIQQPDGGGLEAAARRSVETLCRITRLHHRQPAVDGRARVVLRAFRSQGIRSLRLSFHRRTN